MCGIAGIFKYDNEEPVIEEILRRMTRTIAHRGPDDAGFYFKGPIGLGHRRLSIIDVKGGHQPIFNEEGDIAIVFNGEIYNYRELAQVLRARGHKFRTNSDTETIVHLYEDFGEACVSMLRGMFAFAIWDGRNNRVMLARDRLGKKPLYYAALDGEFVFGSELKAVVENESVPRVLDERAIADYFSFQYIPAPKTVFRHVRKLKAGHYLIVTPDGITDREYWDIDFSQPEQQSVEDWSTQLLESIFDAIDIRLMSEVPLGAFLSGGIDSSAVVAMMSQVSAEPVITTTVGFAEEEYSEIEVAREFAGETNTDHHECIVTTDIIETLGKLAWHFDEPFADASAIPAYYVSKASREFVTVALSGDGGDENFVGYRRYIFDSMENRVRDLAPAGLTQPLFGMLAAIYPKADWLPQPLRAKATFRNLSLEPAEAYFRSVYGAMAGKRDSLLSYDLQMQMNGYDPIEVFLDYYRRPHTDDPVSRAQYVDIKTYLADDILTKVDRASMAASLEVRCPLLDHRLMTMAARIPSKLKLRGREGKYIFKRALSGLLPPKILNRRKKGFVVPLTLWLRGGLREFAYETIFSTSAKDGVIEGSFVRKLWDQHQSGYHDYSRALWAILMFRLWQENFMK